MDVPIEQRKERVQQKMRDKEVDLILLSPGPNMKYVTGFEAGSSDRHKFLAVPAQGKAQFFIPKLIREEVEETGIDTWLWEENPSSELGDFLSQFDSNKVLLDDKMWEKFSSNVRAKIDAETGLASEVMDYVRAVKNEDEIQNIRKASEIADEVVRDVRSLDPVGMTEIELRDFIEDKMEEYGGEGPSFDTIVAVGSNGAKPHHEVSEREIKSEVPVVLDFGCLLNGYPSDQTRTIVFGKENPPEKVNEVFEIVKKAQEKGVQAVEPGVQDSKIDEVTREFIEEAGYGDEFIHRTGHGVGIEIHEAPKIPPKDNETSMELEPGMVFSVEPGIYIEGEFGVRIEDLVLVTEDGCERLNKTERGLS